MTDLERLARNSFERRRAERPSQFTYPWAVAPDEFKREWICTVSAVLTELREPSEGMLKDNCEIEADGVVSKVPNLVRDFWQGMIDHILQGK